MERGSGGRVITLLTERDCRVELLAPTSDGRVSAERLASRLDISHVGARTRGRLDVASDGGIEAAGVVVFFCRR
jgi:hypothetical protein